MPAAPNKCGRRRSVRSTAAADDDSMLMPDAKRLRRDSVSDPLVPVGDSRHKSSKPDKMVEEEEEMVNNLTDYAKLDSGFNKKRKK